MSQKNYLYLLIHTMIIADYNFIIRAQFFHTFLINNTAYLGDARLIGRRIGIRMRKKKDNGKFEILTKFPNGILKNALKRNTSIVKHHLRTIHIGPEFTRITPTSPHQQHHHQIDHSTLIPQNILTQNSLVNNNNNSNPQSPDKKDDGSTNDSIINEPFNNNNNNNQLTQYSNPDETVHWLTANRFEKYLDIFSRFSGSDMLRMSRDDVIQICGHADGIRLHNALHLRAIAPKLKIYVCRDSTMPIFNVLFLTSYNQAELLQKLCSMVSINQEQVKAIYLEGPENIRIQLNDDFLKHIDDETMFTLNIVRENHNDNNYCYVFLLKRKVKQ